MNNILFIDDELSSCCAYITHLTDKGFSITTAENGSEALKIIKSNHLKNFSLVILDNIMPSGNQIRDIDTEFGKKTGVLLYNEIKKVNCIIPVIFLTIVRASILRDRYDLEIEPRDKHLLKDETSLLKLEATVNELIQNDRH